MSNTTGTTWTVEKSEDGKGWVATNGQGRGHYPTKRAATEFANAMNDRPRVAKADGKGWDLIVAGTVVATYGRKAEAERELRAALADVEAVEAETAPEPEPTVDPKEMGRVERLQAAKAERAAVKAWEAAGSEGDRPATPVLDLMADGKVTGKAAAKAKKSGSGAKGGASRLPIAEEDRPAVLAKVTEFRRAGLSWAKIADEFTRLPYRTPAGEPIPVSPLYLLAKHAPEGDLRNVKED